MSCEPVRVLLVDDNEAMLTRAAAALGADCIVVGKSMDGQAALRAAQLLQPDVVVLDISMPGMSVLQLLEQLKRRYPDTAVIMMTSYTSVEVIQQAIRGGAADFLSKPFALAEVWQTVERALGKSPAPVVAGASESASGD